MLFIVFKGRSHYKMSIFVFNMTPTYRLLLFTKLSNAYFGIHIKLKFQSVSLNGLDIIYGKYFL